LKCCAKFDPIGPGYGPRPGELLATLAANRWSVDGFELVRSTSIPDLEDPCGHFLIFRQLIECGETRERTGLPKQPESYNALHDLAPPTHGAGVHGADGATEHLTVLSERMTTSYSSSTC